MSKESFLTQDILVRIQDYAKANSSPSMEAAITALLKRALDAYEADAGNHFSNSENEVLKEAMKAMQDVPDDQGFSLIGRVQASE